ncbi:MAG: hypothetical protein LBB15_02575 [Puniceicoccales bacterium]|jgi:DNA-binding Lrp family transcriptional regulator|nr:hypothetical protein [Puniceicoccales bacterium]
MNKDMRDSHIYEIVTSSVGAFRFRYDAEGKRFISIKKNGEDFEDAYRFSTITNDVTPGVDGSLTGPLVITLDEMYISGFSISVIEERKISKLFASPVSVGGTGLVLPPDCKIYSEKYGNDSSNESFAGNLEMMAIMNDPVATILYTTLEGFFPGMITLVQNVRSLTRCQLYADRIIMHERQQRMKDDEDTNRVLEEQANSKLLIWLNSPWSRLLLFVSTLLIVVAVIVSTVLTGGTALAIILPIILGGLGLVGAGAYCAVTIVNYISDDQRMKKLMEERGYYDGRMSKVVMELCDKFREALLTLFIVTLVVTVISVALSFTGGGAQFKSAVDTVSHQMAKELVKKLEGEGIIKTEEEAVKEVAKQATVKVIVQVITQRVLLSASTANGGLLIASSIIREAVAEVEFFMANVKARTDEWGAFSKLFKEMTKRMEDSLKNLQAIVEDLMRMQSDIIKMLGEGSQTVTRNFVGV